MFARGSLAMLLAITGAVGCAPDAVTEEDELLSVSPWVTRSCGVAPTDQGDANQLNQQLRSRLARAMNAQRVACARVIVQTVMGRGLGERAAQIAIATAIVETNLENITVAVDHDSLGLFQQRPSTGWGAPNQLIDPVYATNAFLNGMIRTYGKDGWRNQGLGTVAQGVQRSAFPGRYEVEANDALLIVRAIGGGTSCPGGKGTTVGEIDKKYVALGGCKSILGAPVTNEIQTPDKVGRFSVFERGSIYWTEKTGAHEVHGKIRDRWAALGWEAEGMGYPTTDEIKTPDQRGRYNVFEGGSIYWTEKTGAHEVRGAIRDEWAKRGWEAGELGYPTADAVTTAAGVMVRFEHGTIEAGADGVNVTMADDEATAVDNDDLAD